MMFDRHDRIYDVVFLADVGLCSALCAVTLIRHEVLWVLWAFANLVVSVALTLRRIWKVRDANW